MTTRMSGQSRFQTPLRGGGIGNMNRYRTDTLVPEAEYRAGRTRQANTAYDTALDNPSDTLGIFRNFYQDAANAYTAQAGRDFQQTIGTVAGNIGRRFGGNASSYEGAQVQKAGDIYSRGVTEALAGLAPQAAGQALQYTSQLGDRAQMATGNYDSIQDMIFRSLQAQRENEKKKGGLLGGLGGALGGIAGGLIGGPAGAQIGATVGGRL